MTAGDFKTAFRVHCPVCKKEYTPELANHADFEEKLFIWQDGALIQNVWPDATDDQREQIQSGICSEECWEQACPEEDDEDEWEDEDEDEDWEENE